MLMRKARRHGAHLLVAGIALPAVVLVGWITFVTADRLFGAEVVTRADAILSVQSATLERQLDKFRLLPPLLAQRPDVRALIAARDRDKGERTAAIAAGMAGADEVAFLDRQGVLIATSHLVPRLAIVYPQDIGPLPFAEALEGRLGRAYRQGTPQAPGSYVFASAVRDETGVIGVVAVRVSLAEVEQAWALTPAPIVAVDADGSIVASNRAEWRGQKLGTHVQATGPRTVRQRVAGESGRSGPGGEAGAMTVRINGDDRSAPYLMVDCTLPVLDWRIAAFADLSDAVSQARKATAIAVLLMLLLSGGAWVAADRRQAALRRAQAHAAAQAHQNYLTDFDWQLQYVLSSSTIASLREPLVLLLLRMQAPGAPSTEQQVELSAKDLDAALSALDQALVIDEQRPAFIVPSDDNGGLHTLLRPDMTLPGRNPSIGLKRRAIPELFERLPDGLQRLDLLVNGEENFRAAAGHTKNGGFPRISGFKTPR